VTHVVPSTRSMAYTGRSDNPALRAIVTTARSE
jgi:hypothetical protein